MGYIKKTIRQLSKDAGGKRLARKEAEAWFETSKKKMNEKSVAKTTTRFLPGKIYVFRYDDPKYKDVLEWWDRNPVVLALNSKDSNDLGINLNLLPVDVKEELLDFVYDRLEGSIKNKTMGSGAGNALAQGHITLTYDGASAFLERFGFDFAIRRYIPSRKASQAVVAYEEWPRITLCDFIDLNGASVGSIKSKFRNHLKKKNI